MAVDGVTDTVSAGTVIFIVTALDVSATEVALIITAKSLANEVAGAVYNVAAPLSVLVGETVPQGAAEQDTAQVTPAFDESFAMVAIKLREWP